MIIDAQKKTKTQCFLATF